MATKTVADFPRLHQALGKFVTINNNFESSVLDTRVIESLGAAADLTEAAKAPIQARVISHSDAVLFGYVVQTLGDEERKTDAAVPPFDIVAYYQTVTAVYDIAAQSAVWDLAEDSDDEDSDDEEDLTDDDSGEDEGSAEGIPEASLTGPDSGPGLGADID